MKGTVNAKIVRNCKGNQRKSWSIKNYLEIYFSISYLASKFKAIFFSQIFLNYRINFTARWYTQCAITWIDESNVLRSPRKSLASTQTGNSISLGKDLYTHTHTRTHMHNILRTNLIDFLIVGGKNFNQSNENKSNFLKCLVVEKKIFLNFRKFDVTVQILLYRRR